MKDLIIYKALRMGLTVTIDLREYKMDEGEIVTKLSAYDGKTSRQDVWVLAIWGNQLPFLIELGNRATDKDIALIAANITLQSSKENK